MGDISARHLSYTYRDNGIEYQALDDISFSIASGEFVCIIGHSGCGKTTLLRTLAGLSKPDKGELYINDMPIKAPGLDRTMVFQQYSLFPWMTVRKNVEFGIRQMNKKMTKLKAAERAQDYLKKVGMESWGNQYPFQLSGGMKQRVAIARSLAVDADILLLDEPFGALDAKTRDELQQVLLQLWSGCGNKKTIIFVTHDMNEALYLSDRIFFMASGQLFNFIDVPFSRPRMKSQVAEEKLYVKLKTQLTELFYTYGEEKAYEK